MAEKEGSAQLGTAQAINKLLEQRSALLDKQADQLSRQVSIAMELCKALECEDLDGVEQRMQGMTAAMKEAQEEAQKTGDDLEEAMKKAGEAAADAEEKTTGSGGFFSKLTPAVGGAIGAIGGFGLGLKGMFGLLKAGVKGVFGLVKAFGKLAFSIVMLPFKMLSGLISMAQEEMGGGSPLREAIEETREAFESLSEGVGGKVMQGFRQMRKESGNLAGSGRTLASIFGPGPEGYAEALKFTTENTKAFGLSVGIVNNLSKKAFSQMVIYRKAMNLSAEATAGIMSRAMDLGVDPMKAMQKFASAAKMMAKSAKVDFKVIAKGMTEVMEDLDNFGHLGESAMAAVAAYAAKTGLEIKTLGQMTQKFLNFEDAAKSAAQLNQALGMNLDTMKLMKGGADSIDEINRAFRATGRTYKDLSAAEKAMISQATGLQGAQLQAALGERTKRNEMKKFNKQAKQQERMIMNQEKLMKQLGKMIKKVFGSGSKQFKGFFDAFIQGFDRGVKKSQPMRKLFRNITRSLYATHKAGRQVGRDFVNFFPGFKEFIKGLSDFFSPKNFRPMLGEVTKIFRQFFKDLEHDPDAGFEKFFDRLKSAFEKFFSGSKGAGSSVMSGGKKILAAVGAIFKNLLIKAAEGIAFLMNKMADIIENPAPLATAASKAFSALGKAFGRIFKIFMDRIAPPLVNAMGRLFTVVAKRLKESEFLKSAVSFLGKVFIAKLMLSMLVNAVKGSVVLAIGKKIGMVLMNVIKPPVGGAVMKGAGSFWATLFGASAQAAPAASANNATDPASAIAGAKKAALFISIGLAAAAVAVLAIAGIVQLLSVKTVKKTAMFALAMAAMMVPVIGVTYAASLMNAAPAELGYTGMTKIAVVMAGLGVVGVSLLALLKLVGDVKLGTMLGFLAVMVGMTMAAIPVYIAAVAIGTLTASTAGLSEGALYAGLFSLTVVMAAVGLLGVAMVKLLGTVNADQAKVAGILMVPLALLLTTIGAVLIPALIFAGVVAMSGFGLGALALLAGLATISLVVKEITNRDTGVIPAIIELAKLPIPNPEGVASITKAIASLVKAVASMMVGLAKVIDQADDFADDTTEMCKLFDSVRSIIDAIMKNGIVAIVDKLVALAKTKDIGDNAAKAMGAISNGIKAAAAFVQAVQFPDGFYSMMEEIDDDEEIANVLGSIKDIMNVMMEQLTGPNGIVNMLLGKLLTGEFMTALNKMPHPDKVAQFVNAISGLIKAAVGMMKGIQMDSNTKDVLNKLTKDDNDETVDALKEVRLMMENNIRAMGGVIKKMMSGIGGVMKDMQPIFKTIENSKADADKLGAAAQVLSAVLNPIGNIVSNIMPVILEFAKMMSKKKNDFAASMSLAVSFNSAMASMQSLLENTISAVNNLDMSKLFGGITNAISMSGVGPKRMEAAAKLLGPVVNMITGIVTETSKLATQMVKYKMEKIPAGAEQKAKAVAGAADQSKGILAGVGNMINTMDLSKPLNKVFALIKKNKMSKEQIDMVAAITGFINAMMSIFTTMLDIFSAAEGRAAASGKGKAIQENIDYYAAKYNKAYEKGSGGKYTQDLLSYKNSNIDKLNKLKMEAVKEIVPKLSTMFEQMVDTLTKDGGALKKLLTALTTKVPRLPKNIVDRAKNLVAIVQSVTGLVAALTSKEFTKGLNKKKSEKAGADAGRFSFEVNLERLNERVLSKSAVKQLRTAVSRVKSVGNLGLNSKNVASVKNSFEMLQTIMGASAVLDDNSYKNVGKNIEALAGAIETAVNKFDSLRGLKGGGRAAIVQIADALTKPNKTLKIESDDMNINVNVEVKLDAEKLETKLRKTQARKKTGKATPKKSDARLKKDITRLGKSASGIPTYTFRYKDDPSGTLFHGAMAQDLLTLSPNAVVVQGNGYYAVDYDKIDVGFYPVQESKAI